MVLASRVAFVAVLAVTTARAQFSLETEAKIDAAAQKVLAETGVPSASLGIVKDGRIFYTHAYGFAHIDPAKSARPDMAYPIGSISKQFTATAILLLQQDGKLKLDDPVSKYFPELTRAGDITLRNLLTMSSGYEDYAPQDYIIPAWLKPTEPSKLVREWAGKPLDFEPGTDWQYSNTNFVLSALIVEKVSGEPLGRFLEERIFKPLGMTNVINTYTEREKLPVTGYVSYALARPREQALEAEGWYFGDGDLAMSAATLLQWDISIINQSLLTPASYAEFATAFKLKDGRDTSYGLGVFSRKFEGRREIEHGGEVGGFVAENVVYPDDKIAIAVLTNQVASTAATAIVAAIKPFLLPPAPLAASTDTFSPSLQKIIEGLQQGKIDRSLFTADCNAYFSEAALADFRSTLAPMGTITGVKRRYPASRGGMEYGLYRATFNSGTTVMVSIYRMPDGKIEQLLVVGKG